MSEPEFHSMHEEWLQACEEKAYDRCVRLYKEIERIWPGTMNKPFIKHCTGFAARPHSRNNMPKGGRHRWMYYLIYGEERCQYCNCQREDV